MRRKKVLQIDRNGYYGGACASLNLKELYEKFGVTYAADSTEQKFGSSRNFAVDLVPKFCMANGKLIKMLIQTGVTSYMDFNGIHGSYVLNTGKIYRIPVTPKEVLTSSLVGLRQKFALRSLAEFCNKYKAPLRIAYTLTKEEFKETLTEYYSVHNQQKTAEVGVLVDKFDDRRDLLVQELELKYGFPVFAEEIQVTFGEGPLGIVLESVAVPGKSPTIQSVVRVQKFAKFQGGAKGQAEKGGVVKPSMYIIKVNGQSVIGMPDKEVHQRITTAPRPLDIVFIKPAQLPDKSQHDLTKMPMRELYKAHNISEDNQNMIGHAMALHTDDTYLNRPAEETVMAIQLYARSMGRFGQDSPYLYPMYGLSSLPEGFSRLAAIYGGDVMLRTEVEEILFDDEGKAIGVRCGDKVALADMIIGDASYFPPEKSRKVGQVIRSVCLNKQKVKSTSPNGDSAQVILPAKHLPAKTQDVYISMLSKSHNVTTEGTYLAIASTQVETSNPQAELTPAYNLMGPIGERFDSVTDIYAPTSDGKSDRCFVTNSLDATSHFESAARDIMRIYKNIFGVELDLDKKIVEKRE